ncbi:hypothetical protein CEE44_03275 [Candidatus Woesearchaeota archaeon B3_Woes]|nr:MAG: hypothetical protein CEE44_03275 [Candidatus Woesearchaeota archaeon B3_Woes]
MRKVKDFIAFRLHHKKPKKYLIETNRYEILIKRDIKRLKNLAAKFELNVRKSKLFQNNKPFQYNIIINGKRLIKDTEDLGICLKDIIDSIFNENEQINHIKKSVKNNLKEVSKYAIGMKILIDKIIDDLAKISGTSNLVKDADEIKETILSNLLIIPEMMKSSDFIEEQKGYEKFIQEFNDELEILKETTDHEEDLVEDMAA